MEECRAGGVHVEHRGAQAAVEIEQRVHARAVTRDHRLETLAHLMAGAGGVAPAFAPLGNTVARWQDDGRGEVALCDRHHQTLDHPVAAEDMLCDRRFQDRAGAMAALSVGIADLDLCLLPA